MRSRHPIIVSLVALCLALSAGLNPAFANGLIPTEKLAGPMTAVTAQPLPPADSAQTQRSSIESSLIMAGVDATHARARVQALTDAEVNELSQRIATAPAGGVWFLPFLLVAAVIGVLIGTRESQAGTGATTTNLFGRTIANVP